jgi:rhamnosyltransferase subunit B
VPLFRQALSLMRQTYERIAELHKPATTVLGALRIALAARFARESLEVPLATLVINPLLLRSVHSLPQLARRAGCGRSRPLGGARTVLVGRSQYDRLLKAPLNAFRAEIGLAPLGRVSPWLNSPQRVIGL